MSLPCDQPTLAWAAIIVPAALTFLVGLLVPRIWVTKKERRDFEQTNFQNTTKLIEQHDQAYDEYTKAIAAYAATPGDTNAFVEIATKGDRYLYQLNLLAAAIMSDKVDQQIRDEVLLQKVRSAATETLPDHYKTLVEIAKKHGLTYSGELKRSNYGAIFAVAEKYGNVPVWSS